jgi:zinc transport system substrate-binding protein
MRRAILALSTAALSLAALAGCDDSQGRKKGQPVRVAASLPPLADITRRIGGAHVEVRGLVKPGENPHTYTPPLKQFVWVENAQMLVIIGTNFEARLAEKVRDAYPDVDIVQTSAGVDMSAGAPAQDHHDEHGHAEHDHAGHEHHDHSHREAHDHDHGGGDPHIWLDPIIVRDHVAPAIAEALIAEAPEFERDFRANLELFRHRLTRLHERISESLKPLDATTFYVYHPAFGHFARRYGMKQEAIELEGKSPSPKRIDEIIARARADNVRVIFVQEQFSDSGARTITERIGGAVVPLDPLQDDYVKMLESIADTLRTQLADQDGS